MADLVRMNFDDGGFKYFLNNIKAGKLKTALKQGLRKTLNIIKKQAVSNLRDVKFKSGHLNLSKPVTFKKNGETYTLPSFRKGVRVKINKNGLSGFATIMSKNFILRMIHNAKGERHTKGRNRKAHSTGSIGPRTFFNDAVDSTKTQVQSSLQENLNDAIMKARDKFFSK